MKQEIERIARRTVAMQRSQGYLTLRRQSLSNAKFSYRHFCIPSLAFVSRFLNDSKKNFFHFKFQISCLNSSCLNKSKDKFDAHRFIYFPRLYVKSRIGKIRDHCALTLSQEQRKNIEREERIAMAKTMARFQRGGEKTG